MSNYYGFKCPKCGQDTEFAIVAHHTININGDDIDHDDSLTWENDDAISCQKCSHQGTVKSFETD